MQVGALVGPSKCKWDDAFKSNPEVNGAHRETQKGPAPQVGDYVQWTSDGVDQFEPARKFRQIQDRHVLVDGSQTGIPI
jgi:hypothetical protein